MDRNNNVYAVESDKSVPLFIADFSAVVEANKFVVSNPDTMNMKATLHRHGGEVPPDFDLHMMQVCKPTKADRSLSFNQERAILMPKFVHVFSQDTRTQVRCMRYSPEQISAMVPGDPQFPETLEETFEKICTMIDEAK